MMDSQSQRPKTCKVRSSEYCRNSPASDAMRLHDIQMTMSNWEVGHLDRRQINYAALDALITGDLFRALRSQHAKPSSCTGEIICLSFWIVYTVACSCALARFSQESLTSTSTQHLWYADREGVAVGFAQRMSWLKREKWNKPCIHTSRTR